EPNCVMACVQATQRMTHKDEGGEHTSPAQTVAQLVGHLGGRTRHIDPLAPAGSGAVIEHAGRELSRTLVDVQVVQPDRAPAPQDRTAPGGLQGPKPWSSPCRPRTP